MSLELAILSGALTACIIYIIQMNRNDMQRMKEELNKSIHGLRGDVQDAITKIAVLEERLRHYHDSPQP